MKHRILVLLALAPFAPAWAQTASIPETIVTATRIPTPQERLPAATTVIDRQIIEERGYVTLADALVSVPGFRIVQNGGLGQQSSGFMRGTNSNHVLVLRDGVPMNDASEPNGAFNFGNTLLGDIERIEVVRGPVSAVYGTSAIGGVINLITRRAPTDRQAQPYGELAGGTNYTARGVAGKGRPARAANSSINCHARTALGSTDSSAHGTPVTVFANVSMNCTHTRQNRGVSPTSAASPGWMPQFRIVSIIPGIDAAAPERTDTKSGSPPEPKRRPVFSSSRARCVWICASSPAGHCPSCS